LKAPTWRKLLIRFAKRKTLITNEVTAIFSVTPFKSISYTLHALPTEVSRIIEIVKYPVCATVDNTIGGGRHYTPSSCIGAASQAGQNQPGAAQVLQAFIIP